MEVIWSGLSSPVAESLVNTFSSCIKKTERDIKVTSMTIINALKTNQLPPFIMLVVNVLPVNFTFESCTNIIVKIIVGACCMFLTLSPTKAMSSLTTVKLVKFSCCSRLRTVTSNVFTILQKRNLLNYI